MSLESYLSRMSGGKQMDLSGASFNKGGAKACTIDEIQGAAAGLGRKETTYLFWAFMPNEEGMQIRVMLNAHLMNWLNKNEKQIPHDTRAKIVRLVMDGVKGSAFQPCKKCETTGKALIDNRYVTCPHCEGLGKVAISKRKIAKALNMAWSTFYKAKVYDECYSELMSFCAILEGACFKHFSDKDK